MLVHSDLLAGERVPIVRPGILGEEYADVDTFINNSVGEAQQKIGQLDSSHLGPALNSLAWQAMYDIDGLAGAHKSLPTELLRNISLLGETCIPEDMKKVAAYYNHRTTPELLAHKFHRAFHEVDNQL